MSQQYNPSPAYGGPVSYYAAPAYNSHPHSTSASPAYSQSLHQQHSTTPLSASNSRRFEAPSHAQSPPVPFQFPPNFDPELLKQMANSNLPLPPPPPPLPFGTSSFPPILYPNFGQQAQFGTQNAVANHQNGQAEPFFHTNAQLPAQDDLTTQIGSDASVSRFGKNQQSTSAPSMAFPGMSIESQNIMAIPPQQFVVSNSDSLDPASQMVGGHEMAQDKTPSNITQTAKAWANPFSSAVRARSAIEDLVKAGISYDNIIHEGIDPVVVKKLFDDLKLSTSPSTAQKPQQAPPIASETSSDRPTHPAPQVSGSNNLTAQKQSAPQAVNDTAMERKDRIARLLAAKRGHPSPAPLSSSASPALSDSRMSTITSKPSVQAMPNQSTNASESSSRFETTQAPEQTLSRSPKQRPSGEGATPQQSAHSTSFLIPGLFMNSADDSDDEGQVPAVADVDTPEQLSTDEAHAVIPVVQVPSTATDRISKRKIADDQSPPAKRQASGQSESDLTRAETQENTSIESGPSSSPPTLIQPDLRLVKHQDESAAPIESSTSSSNLSSTRPKVNQDKLNARMAALKADLLARNNRKKALQDGMPALDAQVQRTKDRLGSLQKSLELVDTNIEQKLKELDGERERRSDVVRQIEQLEQQLAASENGQRNFSNELTNLNDQIKTQQQETDVVEKNLAMQVPAIVPDKQTSTPNIELSVQQVERQNVQGLRHGSVSRQILPGNSSQQATQTSHPEERFADESPPMSADVEDVTPLSAFKSVQGQTTSAAEIAADSDDEQMSIDDDSDDGRAGSAGSASMSDSGSEEYEPAMEIKQDIAKDSLSPDNNDGDSYEPSINGAMTQPTQPTMVDDDDDDEYEPSEAMEDLDVTAHVQPPAFSTQIADDRNVEENNFHTATDDSTSVAGVVEDIAGNSRPKESAYAVGQSGKVDTDTNTKLSRAGRAESPVALGAEAVEASHHFVPYRSPLAQLKSFRFNPQFEDSIAGGYRSLTYSNRIDSKQPLCANELSGEVCSDGRCEEQHFGTMSLSDDKILVQMSSANDIKDKAQRDNYLLGLKKVIAGLRERGVKEFSEVANELSKYRRTWLLAQAEVIS